MRDFGADASDNKCQVRFDSGDCGEQAEFALETNFNTVRMVCPSCLPQAIKFAFAHGSHWVVIPRGGGR